MADTGNIFDNSATVTPSLGQGENTGAGNDPQIDPAVAAPDGQAAQSGEPASTQNTVDWQTEFKTPEEMYAALQKSKQSYENLRPQYTKATMELSNLRKSSRQVVDNQGQADPQKGDTLPADNDPVNMLLNKVIDIVTPVREQNEELMMQNEVARIISANPDFLQYAQDVTQMLKDNPEYWNIKNPVETAYTIVKAKKATEVIATAETNARNQAYADKELKVINPAANRTPVNNGGETKTPEQLIKEGILGAYKHNNSIF